MQWSLIGSFTVTFQCDSTTKCYSGGAWAGKRNVAGERGKMLQQEDCKQHNGYSFESEAASRGTSCSGCVSSAQLLDHVAATTCPPMGEIASQKTSRTSTDRAELNCEKTGIRKLMQLVLIQISAIDMYIYKSFIYMYNIHVYILWLIECMIKVTSYFS